MHAYLIPGLEAAPIVIRRLVEQIREADLDKALSAERFTPREVIAHLADWEPIMRDRVRQAVESPGTTIAAYDEGQMAIENDYANSDIDAQVKIFARERAETVGLVSSLRPEVYRNSVIHQERGLQTVEDLAGMLLGHDMYHVEQLSAYLGDRVAATW